LTAKEATEQARAPDARPRAGDASR
jgi:hypothetical protein